MLITGVLIVALLASAGFFLYRNAMKGLEEKKQIEREAAQRDTAAPIAECVPGKLKVSIGEHATQVFEGDGWSTPIKITNTGKDACLTEGAPKSVGLQVKSGDYDLVDTAKCGDPDYELPLLLGPGKSWESSLEWDGHDYQNCNPGDVAAPGTYVITVTFEGEKKGEAVVSVVPRAAENKD